MANRKPYSWGDWDDAGLIAARSEIERVYTALKHFDDTWEDMPGPLMDAYQSLRALKEYMQDVDKAHASAALAEWNAGMPIKV